VSKPTEAEAAEIAHAFAAALAAFMQTPAYRQWRREQFVKAAMQGILANETCGGHVSQIAQAAAVHADAALNRMDVDARAFAAVQP
jgi:hypothetical protein